jgi:hypothetical protein
MLFEFQDKSKGCSMSMQARPVNAVLKTSGTVLGTQDELSATDLLFRFLAAPTVANTSVSRQTGLTGMWNKSSDPASLTLLPHFGVTSTMRNNTLVVCTNLPGSRCAFLQTLIPFAFLRALPR